MFNTDNEYIDDLPELDPLNPIDYDSPEARIELVNRAYLMKHRTEPYVLNIPADFVEYFMFLSATYMDYAYYQGEIANLLENHLTTLKTTDPALWEKIKSGEADYQDYRDKHPSSSLVASDYLFSVAGTLSEIVDRARHNLKIGLNQLFEASHDIQLAVLGTIFSVPEGMRKCIAQSITENIDELTYSHNMESNRDTFIAHVNKTLPSLIEFGNAIEKNPIQRITVPKISIEVKRDYNLGDLADLKDAFLVCVGRLFDHLDYWMISEDIFELFDETLEHSDASTYANIYLFKDYSDALSSGFLDDLRMAEDALNEQYDKSEETFKGLLRNLLLENKSVQVAVFGQYYEVPKEKLHISLESIIESITDVERDYVMERSRDNFLAYLNHKLNVYAKK